MPELSGIVVSGDSAMFVLVDSDSGESSGWIRIGAEFQGFRVTEFRDSTDTLVLSKDGTNYEVGLRSAVITDSRGSDSKAELPKIEFIGGGRIRLADREIAAADLRPWLEANRLQLPRVEVVAREKTDREKVTQVLDALRGAGITKIRLTTAR